VCAGIIDIPMAEDIVGNRYRVCFCFHFHSHCCCYYSVEVLFKQGSHWSWKVLKLDMGAEKVMTKSW